MQDNVFSLKIVMSTNELQYTTRANKVFSFMDLSLVNICTLKKNWKKSSDSNNNQNMISKFNGSYKQDVVNNS